MSTALQSGKGRTFSWFVFGLMASVTFIGILSELVPSGILPQMTDGLGVEENDVGFLVGVYALASAIAAIPLISATLAMNRKALLMALLAGFAVSNVVVGLSSSYGVIVKGILTPENAVECVQHGASAIQVSNHGGRQLDGVPASFTALRGIVEAVGEADSSVPVFLEGGVRRGIHVFRALAMGASAVAVGRPTLYGLALGGWQGVKSVFDLINEELRLAMKLAGCARLADVTRAFVT